MRPPWEVDLSHSYFALTHFLQQLPYLLHHRCRSMGLTLFSPTVAGKTPPGGGTTWRGRAPNIRLGAPFSEKMHETEAIIQGLSDAKA